MFFSVFMSHWPRPPVPITPMRIRSLAPGTRPAEAAVIVDAARNSLREVSIAVSP